MTAMGNMVSQNVAVMAGHSRPEDGVAPLAYDPAIPTSRSTSCETKWIPAQGRCMTWILGEVP